MPKLQVTKKKQRFVWVPASIVHEIVTVIPDVRQIVLDLKQLAEDLERDESAKADVVKQVQLRLASSYGGRDDR
jgi:hypothetical protein